MGFRQEKTFLQDFLSGFTSPKGLENTDESSQTSISACVTHGLNGHWGCRTRHGSVPAGEPKLPVLSSLGSHHRHWRRSSSNPSRSEWPGKMFVFQSSPWAVSQSQALFTWHCPSHQHLQCSVLNTTVRNKELPRSLPQISPVPILLKHSSSPMTCSGLSLYSQRKLVAAFFGVSFSWLRLSHANKDLFFLLTKTTIRRKFFPMTKARLEFFNRMPKQKASGKGSVWGNFPCTFLKWEETHIWHLVIVMQISIMVFTKTRVLAHSHC